MEVSLFPLLLQLPLRTETDALLGLGARAGKQNSAKPGPEPSLQEASDRSMTHGGSVGNMMQS